MKERKSADKSLLGFTCSAKIAPEQTLDKRTYICQRPLYESVLSSLQFQGQDALMHRCLCFACGFV